MKKIFALFLLLAFFAAFSDPASAVPALNRTVPLKQPDGSTVRLTLRGDEFSN